MVGEESNVKPQKGSNDTVNYQEPNMSSDWQFNGNHLAHTSIAMIPMSNSLVASSILSSAPILDSLCSSLWDQPTNGQSLGYCDVNVENNASSGLGPVRADMGLSLTSNEMFQGGVFPSSVPGILPQSLPHFPADSAFIERAARFSCFSGGNFHGMMNPFGISDPLNSQGLGLTQGHEVFGVNTPKASPAVQSQQHEMNVTVVSKEALLPGKRSVGSPFKNEKGSQIVEAKPGVGVSSNESEEAELSGCDAQEELNGTSGLSSKKRKRGRQSIVHDENNEAQPSVNATKDAVEIKQKDNQNPTSSSKPGGKQGKQGSQGSDLPKEEYIHIRARRGQATNSHSLAERVRREKISERMKFLQDLVPGCSKVTGKAVMLDEIINYVQSLQRQVEFLSMKLATVNPRLDFNLERFLSKNVSQPRAGMPSSLAFPPDITVPFPSLHPSPPGLIQAEPSEALRRPINLQSTAVFGGFKESASQVPSLWEDELHNVVHVGLNNSSSLPNSQDLSGSSPPNHIKAEP